MKRIIACCASIICAVDSVGVSAAEPADVKVQILMSEHLPKLEGKEFTMLSVELAPGAYSAPHQHHAHVYVYVLEGAVVMKTQAGPETTLRVGELFEENPTDIHTVSRNASATAPAKFLAIMIKDVGAPVLIPVETP